MRRLIPLLASPFVALAPLALARAETPAGKHAGPGFELRLGAALHDPASREAGSAAISAKLITPRFAREAWLPLIAIGGSLNLTGRTSHAHVGPLWRFDLTSRAFLELGLGGALHNGRAAQSAHRSAMGCAFAFRESIGLGYRIDERWSIIASAEHLSNGGLCRRNRGLTHLGIAAGYTF